MKQTDCITSIVCLPNIVIGSLGSEELVEESGDWVPEVESDPKSVFDIHINPLSLSQCNCSSDNTRWPSSNLRVIDFEMAQLFGLLFIITSNMRSFSSSARYSGQFFQTVKTETKSFYKT